MIFMPRGLLYGLVDVFRTAWTYGKTRVTVRDMTSRPCKAALLSIVGLSKAFGGLPALDGVTFDLTPGGVTSLIGPNGAGKSTLINCLSGVMRPDAGSVHLDGRRVDRASLPAPSPAGGSSAPSRTCACLTA